MTSPSEQQEWSRRRQEVFAAKEQALQAAREQEHLEATALIREAVERYRAAGIAPVPLRARPYRGSGTLRTGLEGWYLKHDRSLAVDAEGRYYVLRVDGGLRSRLLGATPEPSPAPMIVGRGGRDGDSFALQELLDMRLADPVAA